MSPLVSSPRAHAALEENLWSMWSQFGRGPGCALHEDEGLTWFETPIPVPPYNMVVRFQRGDAAADAAIDAVFAHFAKRRVPFLWLIHPTAGPTDLASRLKARGFDEVEPITGMAADLRNLPALPALPPGVEIHDVTPEHDFVPFMEFVADRWQVPDEARAVLDTIGAIVCRMGIPGSPNRAWLAMKDGVPLAKAFTHDTPGAVGLYGMATKPEARGLGLGRLICIKALAEARARGHDLAVLHATPMAVSLYEHVGFRNIAPLHLYAAPNSFYA
jgi:GNAT superfamily N-acetyltransferase